MRTLSIAIILAICTFAIPGFAQDLPDGEGKAVVVKQCTGCHGAENFVDKKKDKDGWKRTVDTMIAYGADINDADAEVILTYLTKNFGKSEFSTKVKSGAH